MKFDYGDEVVFYDADKDGSVAGAIVSVTEVTTESQSQIFGYPIGTVLYGVELADGSDRLLPEEFLKLLK